MAHAVVLPERLHCGTCGGQMHTEYMRLPRAFVLTASCYRHNCEHVGKTFKVPVATVELEEIGGQAQAG